jgi:hypothetical protein
MGAMGDAVSSFPDFLPPQLREPVLVAIPFFLLLILEWPAARKLEHLESGDQPPAGAYVARGSCRRTSGTRGSSQSSVWTCCSTAITASHIGYGWSGHPSGTSLQRVLQLRHRAPRQRRNISGEIVMWRLFELAFNTASHHRVHHCVHHGGDPEYLPTAGGTEPRTDTSRGRRRFAPDLGAGAAR